MSSSALLVDAACSSEFNHDEAQSNESEPEAALCSTCQALFHCPDKPLEEDVCIPYSKDRHDIHCQICVHIWKGVDVFRLDSAAELQFSHDAHTGRLELSLISPSFNFDLAKLHFYPMSTGAKEPRIEFVGESSDQWYSDPACLQPRPNHTKDEACFSQIEDWLRICTQDHGTCSKPAAHSTASRLPTRLIDIRNKPRLVETNSKTFVATDTRYATLSHRWKKGDIRKLVRKNLKELKKKITKSYITPIFRDAISTTKKLGLNYIWIDVLCIIQDDPQDWRSEASQMGSIYANAFLNLGASAAAFFENLNIDTRIGLFTSRDRLVNSMIPLSVTRLGHSRKYCGFDEAVRPGLDHDSLMERGWIFQERLLSPRSVYFGEQISWECNEMLANEALPRGLDVYSIERKRAHSSCRPTRLGNLLQDAQSRHGTLSVTSQLDDIYMTWLSVAELYSKCEFTYSSDVVPAFSGIATGFQSRLNDQYIAGLWRKDMIRGLLWHSRRILHKSAPSSSSYLAPSWSWLAATSKVDFQFYYIYPKNMIIANMLEAAVFPEDRNFTGPFTEGFVCVMGDLRPSQRTRTGDYSLDSLGDPYELYDYNFDESGGQACQDIFFLSLTYETDVRRVHGLILESTGQKKDEYRRVGAFSFATEEREEFKDFDWENLERQTITIV